MLWQQTVRKILCLNDNSRKYIDQNGRSFKIIETTISHAPIVHFNNTTSKLYIHPLIEKKCVICSNQKLKIIQNTTGICFSLYLTTMTISNGATIWILYPTSPTMNMNDDHNKSRTKRNMTGVNNDNVSKKGLKCDVCEKTLATKSSLQSHKLRHTGINPYKCHVCEKQFFRKDYLIKHYTTHTKPLQYHCFIWNRGFRRHIAVQTHFLKEHCGQDKIMKTCFLCNYQTETMELLRIHLFDCHKIIFDDETFFGN